MFHTRFWIGGALLLACALPAPAADQRRAEALALAARIDRLIEKAWADNKVVPAPPIDDGAFLRRIYLHLAGRIPSVYEVRRFLEDKSSDKRIKEIETLLAGQRYPLHLAHVWRAFMLPEASGNGGARGFGPGLETWLRSRFAAGVSYDKMIRELLIAPSNQGSNRLTLDLSGIDFSDGTTPLSFYQAKQYKPENLAEVTARMFLGVRLGCAQCHNHPTAQWKRDQFWEFAAFFADVRPQNSRQPLPVNAVPQGAHELKIPNTEKVAQAKFLDGKTLAWKDKDDPRAVLAEWITRKDNPYFAKATVNRLWSHFFGAGIVEPVDEMVGDDNLPSHPELLDELAREFVAHDFDLKYLILAITSSKVYQLSSAQTHPSQAQPRLFARAPLLGMTPEQLFDSVAEATRCNDTSAGQSRNIAASGREEFLTKFNNLSDRPTEYQTSIIQALSLMNGRLTTEATSLERSQLLAAVASSPFLETPGRIETLYLATLSRKPNPREMSRAVRFIEAGDKNALADLFWALLNSGEFFFNH